MNLEQYVKDAIRTESRIDQVEVVDPELFYATLEIFIKAGSILDKYKKNVFYKKPIDWNEVDSMLEKIEFLSECGPSVLADQETLYARLDIDPRVFHAIIGIATEATELVEALEEAPDTVNVLEEFGDVNWYQAIGIDALGGDFENILNTNIEKLRKRFPEKFTSKEAIDRDVDSERDILEQGLVSQTLDNEGDRI